MSQCNRTHAKRQHLKGCDIENILIRACTRSDIDAIVQLERHWELEDIAYGDFNPISREVWIDNLECFPAYFLVAECGEQLVGY
ncbi:MAG: hypothetical protein ABIV47_28720, partial [Roseiflexaceae bacterium]